MKKIIVTGGLGFIGSNLIDLLLKKNYKDDKEEGKCYSYYENGQIKLERTYDDTREGGKKKCAWCVHVNNKYYSETYSYMFVYSKWVRPYTLDIHLSVL